MKIFSPALLAFLLLPVSVAQAAVTMVSGNIYDVGKYSFSQDEELYNEKGEYIGKRDGAMCWAAAAANVIQYWQDEYKRFADNSSSVPNGFVDSGYGSPDGTAYLQVYQTILQNWTLGSGVSMNAIGWWMQGRWVTTPNSPGNKYASAGGSNLENSGLDSGGYYSNVFGDWRQLILQDKGGLPVYPNLTNASFYSAQAASRVGLDKAAPGSFIQGTLKAAFSKDGQAVALSLLPSSGTGHAITCWGYEEDKNGKITSLILSDSDDSRYGTFMAELAENKDGTVSIRSDRYLSWYHGSYQVLDATYIATPETTLDGKTAVAKDKSDGKTISTISNNTVKESCTLTTAVNATQSITIGGGTYDGTTTPSAIVFTAEAALSVQGVTGSAPALKLEDGSMTLFNGGLTVQNNSSGGVVVDSHLYIHGGDVIVTGNSATHSGAGIYASDVNGKGLYAKSYAEIKGAGDVTISDNAVTKDQYTTDSSGKYSEQSKIVFGGGLAEEDSITIRDSGAVHIERNSVQGTAVFGGGAAAPFQATLDGNKSVTFTDNELKASGNLSEGGGLAAMFIDMCGNGSVEFSGNSVQVKNESMFYHEQSDTNSYVVGAHANGGAVAASYINPLMSETWDYLAAKLNIDDNGSVSFNGNRVDAQYSYGYTNQAYAEAEGGALFLDSLDGTGSQASVSRNTGNVVFYNNTATAAASTNGSESHARGGAVYVGENGVLDIKDNKANVVFDSNSVSAATAAQGGAIYNGEGSKLSISNNAGTVLFIGNSAKEGNDLYNAEGAKAEIVWNEHVELQNSAETKEQDSVVNKGTLYLAAAQDKSIDFVNAKLNSDAGTVVIGADMAGEKGSGTVKFMYSSDSEEAMSVSAKEGMSVTLKEVSIDLNGMVGASSASHPAVENMVLTSSRNVTLSNLTLAANNVVTMTGQHQLTLSDVVIDLSSSSVQYTRQETENGVFYNFNLQSLLGGAVTLSNVVFDASSLTELKDGVAFGMDFGSDVSFNGDAVTTLQLSGTAPTQVTLKSGMVVFGDASVVPEPATTTLSLLALAGLCARRRRRAC